MTIHVEGLVREEVCQHHFTADKCLQGQGGEHVEAKAKTCNVDHGVVCGKVVEDIA